MVISSRRGSLATKAACPKGREQEHREGDRRTPAWTEDKVGNSSMEGRQGSVNNTFENWEPRGPADLPDGACCGLKDEIGAVLEGGSGQGWEGGGRAKTDFLGPPGRTQECKNSSYAC